MQKSQKAEVLDFVRNMHQAHDEVREALERKEIPVIQNMLCDCQELAIALGNLIEELEGEGFVTVSYIEQYCEVLYHILIKIRQGNFNPHKIHKQLKKYTLRIENSIRSDITARKEVVFFPYKASMWDSLESLYLKYREAPDTDVLCVPIPYYELNPDGTFGRMHYEGSEYPENIDITDWENYSFEKSHPDEIYIHNAYDNWNLVTSVHPRFYSDQLKKHTDKLVYVPYFVMGDIDIDQPGVAESKKHFCFLPGIIHADQVILESEAVKKLYVSEYLKAAKKQGLAGEHVNIDRLNQKFVGAGSPKYDKVKYTKPEDIEIPKEWLKIIEKPDGSRKKIILYNTGIAALLEHGEKWVEKIAYALDIFRKHRDEVALLWRPHPLIEETMKTMRPQVLQRYTELKCKYRQEGWGIYDDTADLDRAVVLSDAYYGDPSSVVHLFQETKKQVMIQNVDCRKTEEMIRVSPSAFCVDGDDVWIMHAKLNVFFRYNLRTKKTRNYSLYPYGKAVQAGQYSGIHVYGNKIYFVPCWESQVLVYHLDDSTISVIEENQTRSGRFGKTFTIGKFLYCIPIYEDFFLKIDMKNEYVSEKIYWRGTEYEKRDCINSAFVYENNICCVILNRKQSILVLDKEDNLHCKQLAGDNVRYSTGCVRRDRIYLYSPETCKVYEFMNFGEKVSQEIEMMPIRSCKLFCINDRWLVQEEVFGSNISVLDQNYKIFEKNMGIEVCQSISYGNFHGLVDYYIGMNFYYDRRKNVLMKIDGENNVCEHYILMNSGDIHKICNSQYAAKAIIEEVEIYGLSHLIETEQGDLDYSKEKIEGERRTQLHDRCS